MLINGGIAVSLPALLAGLVQGLPAREAAVRATPRSNGLHVASGAAQVGA